MAHLKKIFILCLVVSLLLSMTACGQPVADTPTEPTGSAEYTVTVRSQGGMGLRGIDLYIYDGDDLAGFGQTDETGRFTVTLPQKDSYHITLDQVPKGYSFQDRYAFQDSSTEITLASSLITEENLSGAVLGVGDVMYDFTVTDCDGDTVTLSQVLQEKNTVVLNFWYSSCGPCANEFPFMQTAYEAFSEDAAIIALNPLEDAATVASYKANMGLSFHMAACAPAWANTFSVSGYPTSVVIDRYGVICLVEVGAITSLRPFTKLFEHFTADDYTQKLFAGLGELVTAEKPTVSMASSPEVAAVLSPGLGISYRPETQGESAEYAWPFVITEKNGEPCVKASNQDIPDSFAILYADVYLEEGQAVAFDYLSSTEGGCDVLYVIVDGQDVYRISGMDEVEVWRTCYPWIATESRVHEVALCYLKDSDTDTGDDTVYIKNLHLTDVSAIDTPTYIPRLAATEQEDGSFGYVDIVLSESDGYYHVGTADGPLLLADLMGYTQFNPEKTLWELTYDGVITRSGANVYDEFVDFFSYASNSQISGVTPVTEGLLELFALADLCSGFDENDPMEWLKLCTYYQNYGTDTQLSDPIAGLSTFSAYEAKLGKNIPTNYFYYDRPIMPRGLLAEFTPQKSGVYLITSHSDSINGVDAWIFSSDNQESGMYTYAADQRLQPDVLNCYMYYYMEAGKTYYIDIAFWDIYETGYIYYDIAYVGASYNVFRLASPGFFTYDTNATGEHMYDLISGGIDVVLGEDGIYYEDLGDGKKGSKLYCDFTGITGVFSDPIASVQAYDKDGKPLYDDEGKPVMRKGLIDKGAFDFSKTEYDQYILTLLDQHNGDAKATEEYLRAYWGTDYDANAEAYQLTDVFAGRYHGHGEDYTAQIEAFLDEMITSGPVERRGCVVVTEELAVLLQLLMDKFTFEGVDNSWTKLCYYYDYLGA